MKIVLLLFIVFVLACIVSWIIDTHRFVVRNYEVESPLISKNAKAVILSDLHNKKYGPHNEKLIAAIDEIHPDFVLIAGDLCNGLKGSDFTPAVDLLKGIACRYPIYYGMGNHEYRLRLYPKQYGTMWEDYNARIEELGIRIMDNETTYLSEYNIDISAVSIDRSFYRRFKHSKLTSADMYEYLGEKDKNHFGLLIAHDPEYFDGYSKWGADLTVSGHVHGGIMRLPLIGGIVSPRLIEFPRYSGGIYNRNDKKLIVSCGLGTHTIHVRVFNPAELAVVDIKKK